MVHEIDDGDLKPAAVKEVADLEDGQAKKIETEHETVESSDTATSFRKNEDESEDIESSPITGNTSGGSLYASLTQVRNESQQDFVEPQDASNQVALKEPDVKQASTPRPRKGSSTSSKGNMKDVYASLTEVRNESQQDFVEPQDASNQVALKEPDVKQASTPRPRKGSSTSSKGNMKDVDSKAKAAGRTRRNRTGTSRPGAVAVSNSENSVQNYSIGKRPPDEAAKPGKRSYVEGDSDKNEKSRNRTAEPGAVAVAGYDNGFDRKNRGRASIELVEEEKEEISAGRNDSERSSGVLDEIQRKIDEEDSQRAVKKSTTSARAKEKEEKNVYPGLTMAASSYEEQNDSTSAPAKGNKANNTYPSKGLTMAAATHGEGQKATTVTASRSQVGAMAMHQGSHDVRRRDVTTGSFVEPFSEENGPHEQPPNNHSEAPLLRAYIVEDEEKPEPENAVLATAEPMPEENKRRTCCIICIVLAIVIGLVLGIAIAVSKNRSDSPPTEAPTIAPSSMPSTTPTFSMDGLTRLVVEASNDGGRSLGVSTSPQKKAFDWLTQNRELDRYTNERILQRYALATFYHSTSGDSWFKSENWLSDDDECEWYPKGTLCHLGGGWINQLDFSKNNLRGSLPAELALLSNSVMSLDLSGNSLTGEIPTTLGLLTNLVILSLDDNHLTGKIPTEVGNITNLEFLDLHLNELSGSIPIELGYLTSLGFLHLEPRFVYFEVMTGNETKPSWLSGTVPTELGRLENLYFLDLHNNLLNGTLPSEIGQLTKLRVLILPGATYIENGLEGTLPSELGLMTSLEVLHLEHNMFTGPIPKEIGNLSSADEILLQYNRLNGTLDQDLFASFQFGLQSLDISENDLWGTIPSEIGLATALQTLNLEFNAFTGTLPSEIGQLKSLEYLSVAYCTLNGTIPSEIGRMQNLETIRLSDNSLYGTIPTEVGNLTRAGYFDVSYNNLVGTLPTELGLMTSLKFFNTGDNALSGMIPSELGALTLLNELILNSNNLTGTIPPDFCDVWTTDAYGYFYGEVDCGTVLCSCCDYCPQPPTPEPSPAPTISPYPTITPIPTMTPTVSAQPTITPVPTASAYPVTIVIQLDDYPGETGWSLTCNSIDIVSVLQNTYTQPGALVTRTFLIDVGATCNFKITDSYGDGLCCLNSGTGYYQILIEGQLVEEGGRAFVGEEEVMFNLPGYYATPMPTQAPSGSPRPTISAPPSTAFVFVSFDLKFESRPELIGWSLDCDNQSLASVPAGSYSFDTDDISVTLPVHNGALCNFTVSGMPAIFDYQIFVSESLMEREILLAEGIDVDAQYELLFISSRSAQVLSGVPTTNLFNNQ